MKQQRLFPTVEGRILIIGAILFFLLLVVTGYYAAVDIETAKTLGMVFIAHTFGGRAAGIGLCIMNGYGPTFTIVYNFYLEVLIVCFAYSFFVLTANNYVRVRWVTNLMERLSQKALEQREKVRSFGWIGIFVFVMLPLPATGPVMGSIIGYMLRISLVRNFTATASGTLTAIIVWFFCFDFLEDRFHAIQYVFAGILLLLLISHRKAIFRLLFGKKE
ncbi:MAG: small multi-drug export protein [Desulfobacterium sp.]|jgi:uncharacterized membrane protein|nr:small multi-drug export protein [Desulfobacterium sp.]